ncbi:MAG: hypothetical protein SOY49_04040 [Prevotella sp.]|nr:hypothetical protein [Prevotella sp.]
MKKLFLISMMAMLTMTVVARSHAAFENAKVVADTIYYSDSKLQVASRADASYYRILMTNTVGGKQQDLFRDYYMNGKLKAQGGYQFVDLSNDKNTVLDGEITTYYINGNEKMHGTYRDGKRQGYFTARMRDGSIAVIEYDNGVSKYDYFMVSHPNGITEKRPISEVKSLLQ